MSKHLKNCTAFIGGNLSNFRSSEKKSEVACVSHCLSKLLEIKIYNSYEQLDIIKTELLGNSIEIEIKIEII